MASVPKKYCLMMEGVMRASQTFEIEALMVVEALPVISLFILKVFY
jgi:hypothetical protein